MTHNATILVWLSMLTPGCTAPGEQSTAFSSGSHAGISADATAMAGTLVVAQQDSTFLQRVDYMKASSFRDTWEFFANAADGSPVVVDGVVYEGLVTSAREAPLIDDRIVDLDIRFGSVEDYLFSFEADLDEITAVDIDDMLDFMAEFYESGGFELEASELAGTFDAGRLARVINTSIFISEMSPVSVPSIDGSAQPQGLGLLESSQATGGAGAMAAAGSGGGSSAGVSGSMTAFTPDPNSACKPPKTPSGKQLTLKDAIAVTEQSQFFKGTCPDYWPDKNDPKTWCMADAGKSAGDKQVPTWGNCPKCEDSKEFMANTCGKVVQMKDAGGAWVDKYIAEICPEGHFNNIEKGTCKRGSGDIDVAAEGYKENGYTDHDSKRTDGTSGGRQTQVRWFQ